MARPRIPFRRIVTLTFLASIAPLAVFAGLAAASYLTWGIAVLSATVCIAALAIMVRRGLGDVYRVLQFSEILARDGEFIEPAVKMSGLFPEFTDAVTRLGQAWKRDRGRLDARVSSAETLLENLPHPLILVNADRQILRMTVGARGLLGNTASGRDLSAMIRDPELLEAVDKVLTGGSRDELVEFDVQFPRNLSLNAQVQSLPQRASDGSAAVIAFYDVTEIRQVQRMRSDFVANASHELRTPLAVLNGCIKTLRGPARDDPEGREKFIAMMEQHTTRMTSLIEDLLSLSRIELNENTVPGETVNLNEALSTVVMTLAVAAAERGIDITAEPALGGHTVTGDRVEIAQLLRNLVDNAVKYSNRNSVIRIVLRETSRRGITGKDEPYIEIAVTDQGAGISAEHLPRLTERFYRVDAARSREMGGTGLGLAIVKHIVNRHRGKLEIQSVEGEGSTFRVYLPVRQPGEVSDR